MLLKSIITTAFLGNTLFAPFCMMPMIQKQIPMAHDTMTHAMAMTPAHCKHCGNRAEEARKPAPNNGSANCLDHCFAKAKSAVTALLVVSVTHVIPVAMQTAMPDLMMTLGVPEPPLPLRPPPLLALLSTVVMIN